MRRFAPCYPYPVYLRPGDRAGVNAWVEQEAVAGGPKRWPLVAKATNRAKSMRAAQKRRHAGNDPGACFTDELKEQDHEPVIFDTAHVLWAQADKADAGSPGATGTAQDAGDGQCPLIGTRSCHLDRRFRLGHGTMFSSCHAGSGWGANVTRSRQDSEGCPLAGRRTILSRSGRTSWDQIGASRPSPIGQGRRS